MATPLWIFYNKFEDALDVTGGFYVKGAKNKEVMQIEERQKSTGGNSGCSDGGKLCPVRNGQ